MSNNQTIVGNLTRPIELRFSASGNAWATFSIADNRKDKDGNEKATFFDCKMFGQMAENATGSLDKGDRVIVTGHQETESWESNGERRTKNVLLVDSIGPDLRFATAKVTKVARNSGGGFSQPASAPVSGDPWASGPTLTDEPPF